MGSSDQRIVDLFGLFEAHGSGHYDEVVTLTEHCLQTAQHAKQDDAADHLVAAALLHDVGHFLLAARRGSEDYLADDWDHEVVGEEYVTELFGPRIGRTVGLHVAAKRYLCATDDNYVANLSAASTASLEVQGGAMGASEISEFEDSECWKDAIMVRRWDDLGKTSHAITDQLVSYGPLLNALLCFDAPV